MLLSLPLGLEKLPESWEGLLDTPSREALQRFVVSLQTTAPKCGHIACVRILLFG